MTARAGVQIYTVLEAARSDLASTLERIAEMGYLGVEIYGLEDHYQSGKIRAALAAAGLEMASAHVPFPAGPDAQRMLDGYQEMGVGTVVWSLEREEFDSTDTLLLGLERVNEATETAAERGIEVAYHNHLVEFARDLDGRQAYDVVLDNLHPDARIALDVYWAQAGGADPAEVVRRVGERLVLVHLKDGPAHGAADASYGQDVLVPLGQGALDMPEILSAAREIDWHLVELERTAIDAFDALDQSFRFLIDNEFSEGRA